MEAHPNEYVAQLLDRAANLIQDLESETSGAEDQGSEAKLWLQEYHAEKARFGQPLGSPAYSDAVQAARGEDVPVQQRQARHAAGTDTADEAGTGTAEDGELDYDTATLLELQEEARRRGLPSSGTKADIRERLEDDDTAANSDG
jgi:hypothetical protein